MFFCAGQLLANIPGEPPANPDLVETLPLDEWPDSQPLMPPPLEHTSPETSADFKRAKFQKKELPTIAFPSQPSHADASKENAQPDKVKGMDDAKNKNECEPYTPSNLEARTCGAMTI